MIKFLIYNEFQKIFYRKRTYIGFILIGILSILVFSCGKKGDPEYNKTTLKNLSKYRLI